MPSLEDIADRGTPDIVAKFAFQLSVAPCRVFLRQAQNERDTFGTDRWSAQWYLLGKGPFPPHKLAMPLQERVGLDQEDDLTESSVRLRTHRGEFADEDEEGEFLPSRNARRMRLFALEDAELVTQEQDFEHPCHGQFDDVLR